jgi:hypothetical protein
MMVRPATKLVSLRLTTVDVQMTPVDVQIASRFYCLPFSKSFSLIDCISVGVDRMQRNFEPMRKQVEAWQRTELMDVTAKVVIYEAFVEGKLEAPKHLARPVHDLYFEPKYDEFRPRTIWSLSNAFTSAFKELDPIPQFRAKAKLGEFLEARFSQSF